VVPLSNSVPRSVSWTMSQPLVECYSIRLTAPRVRCVEAVSGSVAVAAGVQDFYSGRTPVAAGACC
jgi:hypothetical protein